MMLSLPDLPVLFPKRSDAAALASLTARGSSCSKCGGELSCLASNVHADLKCPRWRHLWQYGLRAALSPPALALAAVTGRWRDAGTPGTASSPRRLLGHSADRWPGPPQVKHVMHFCRLDSETWETSANVASGSATRAAVAMDAGTVRLTLPAALVAAADMTRPLAPARTRPRGRKAGAAGPCCDVCCRGNQWQWAAASGASDQHASACFSALQSYDVPEEWF